MRRKASADARLASPGSDAGVYAPGGNKARFSLSAERWKTKIRWSLSVLRQENREWVIRYGLSISGLKERVMKIGCIESKGQSGLRRVNKDIEKERCREVRFAHERREREETSHTLLRTKHRKAGSCS